MSPCLCLFFKNFFVNPVSIVPPIYNLRHTKIANAIKLVHP
jgi:hypothetical protein